MRIKKEVDKLSTSEQNKEFPNNIKLSIKIYLYMIIKWESLALEKDVNKLNILVEGGWIEEFKLFYITINNERIRLRLLEEDEDPDYDIEKQNSEPWLYLIEECLYQSISKRCFNYKEIFSWVQDRKECFDKTLFFYNEKKDDFENKFINPRLIKILPLFINEMMNGQENQSESKTRKSKVKSDSENTESKIKPKRGQSKKNSSFSSKSSKREYSTSTNKKNLKREYSTRTTSKMLAEQEIEINKVILSTFTVTNNRFNIYVSITSSSMFNLMYFEQFVKNNLNIKYVFIYKNVDKFSYNKQSETSLIKKDKTRIYMILSVASFSDLIKNNQNNLSFQEFKNWLNNLLVVLIGLTWNEALSEFEKHNINITIGPTNKKFILRSHEYRLSNICYFLNINENAIFEGSNDKNLIKIPVKKKVSKPEKNIIFFENIVPVESIIKKKESNPPLHGGDAIFTKSQPESSIDTLLIEGPKAPSIEETLKPKIESKIEPKIQLKSKPTTEGCEPVTKPKLKKHILYVKLFLMLCCGLFIFLFLNEIKIFIISILIVILNLLIMIIKSLIYVLEALKNILIYFVSGLN